MKTDAFLSRLEKVKRTGNGQWIACCPAHGDKHPSMTVRETDDGRVLVHCFTGCDVEKILGAVGMDFDALFPDKPPTDHRMAPIRRPFPAADVLECLATETRIVQIAAAMMASGEGLSEVDRERLKVAADLVHQARELALG